METATRTNHFHANVHVPGYLPEGDVLRFDDAESAWSFLVGEISRAWDHEYDGAESTAEYAEIDGRYLEAHTWMHHNNTTRGGVHVDGDSPTHLGYVYEVSECGLADCSDDDE